MWPLKVNICFCNFSLQIKTHRFTLKGPTDIRSTLEYLATLFPRKLFNDSLPQIVLKHQLYSIHDDKTLVDKELVRQLLSVQKVLCASLWMWKKKPHFPSSSGPAEQTARTRRAADVSARLRRGRFRAGVCRRLQVQSAGGGGRPGYAGHRGEVLGEIAVSLHRTELQQRQDAQGVSLHGLRDHVWKTPLDLVSCLLLVCENTFFERSAHICIFSHSRQLVKSGVLTVRDAGSWWLSIPNSGKFTKYFIQGVARRWNTVTLWLNGISVRANWRTAFPNAPLVRSESRAGHGEEVQIQRGPKGGARGAANNLACEIPHEVPHPWHRGRRAGRKVTFAC